MDELYLHLGILGILSFKQK